MPNKKEPALKLNVLFAGFPYGGNGATSSEVPNIRHWMIETVLKMKDDPRIAHWTTKDFSDTPLTMTRNKAVRYAIDNGFHLLLMIDSDQHPNLHAGEPGWKPFWDEAFNFVYENYGKGPHVVGAPYGGPPSQGENVYAFQWRDYGNHGVETQFSLEQYTREQAATMRGIQEVAALPTGLILYDLRIFDLIEPKPFDKRQVLEQVQLGQMSVDEALVAMREGYFYYEWSDHYAQDKASTEDVTNTRDIAMAGVVRLGYNPVHCAWDSWIGHWKPWCVGKPRLHTTEQVGAVFRKAVEDDLRANRVSLDLDALNKSDPLIEQLKRRAVALPESNGHAAPEPVKEWHEYGHAHPDHVAFLEKFVDAESESGTRYYRVMEVGTWLGTTAIAMADAGGTVHCVDTWKGSPSDVTGELAAEHDVYEEFCRRVGERLNRTIFAWQGESAKYAAMDWQPFDLIFIDADHSYEACKADILAWWRHLTDDGVMIGHDYNTKQFPGVIKAVHELFGAVMEVARTDWGSMWMVRKQDVPDLLERHCDKVAQC